MISKERKVNALKLAVAMFFSEKKYYPFFEVNLDQSRHYRADVFMIDGKFKTIIVEIKSSKEDFLADKKWENYLSYCNRFFFCADKETIQFIKEKVEPTHPDIGFLTIREYEDINPYSLQFVKDAKLITFGNFSDPSFLFRLVRSNCTFWQGLYVGLKKTDRSLIDKHYDTTKDCQSKLFEG